LARGAPERKMLGCEPGKTEEQDEGDERLRNSAIQAPDSQTILLNHGEAKGEEKAQRGSEECCKSPARQTEATEYKISGDANDGDRDVVDHRETAVVHDAAVPVLVDVARRRRRGVMEGQSQRRDDDTSKSENSNEISHGLSDGRGVGPSIRF